MSGTKTGYTVEIPLAHNEVPAKIDLTTGEVQTLERRQANIPKDKSPLNYDQFSIVNDRCQKILQSLLGHVEYSVVNYMITIAEFNTNSLRPLNNDTTNKELSERFKIDRRKVPAIMQKLYSIGVYLQLSYFSESEQREVTYWVLNPNIAWKGRLKKDSLFDHFSDTILSKLLA